MCGWDLAPSVIVLEYYVRGLELGNAVFTGFDGTPENYKEYPEKVIDMGAGLGTFCVGLSGNFQQLRRRVCTQS